MIKSEGYKIFWGHANTGTVRNWEQTMNPAEIDLVTTCVIERDGEVIATGRAYKCVEDRHNKEISRKISLTRALRNLTLSVNADSGRSLRTRIWKDYFNRKGKTMTDGQCCGGGSCDSNKDTQAQDQCTQDPQRDPATCDQGDDCCQNQKTSE